MANTPLTKDMLDRPDLCRLAMIIDRDGIDVLVRRVVGDTPAVCARVSFDPSADGPAARIEEAVYANPMLLCPFRRVDVAMRSSDVLMVPAGTSAESVRSLIALDGVAGFSGSVDSHNDAVFFVDRAAANFLSRTYDIAPSHVLADLGAYYAPRSRAGNTAKMYVELTDSGCIDIVMFNSLGLAGACSARYIDTDDAAYRVLAMFRQGGFDAESAEILVAGPSGRRQQLMARVSPFVRHVMPAIPPAGAYHGDPQALRAPLSLLILCLKDENNKR